MNGKQERWMRDHPFVFRHCGEGRYRVDTPAGLELGYIQATHQIAALGRFIVSDVAGTFGTMVEAAKMLMAKQQGAAA